MYHSLCRAIVNYVSVHIRESTILAFQSGKEELPSHGKCKFSAWNVTTSFHIVVSGLSRSLLNLKFHQKL